MLFPLPLLLFGIHHFKPPLHRHQDPIPMLPSASPCPTSSTNTLAMKKKIDQTKHTSRGHVKRKESFENMLCNECRQIGFDQVIGLGSTSRDDTGICIQKVGARFRRRIPTDCLLYPILFDSCIFDTEPKVDGEDELQAFYFLSIFNLTNRYGLQTRGYWRTNSLQCLAVVPSRFNPNNKDTRLRLKSHIQDHGCSVVYRNRDPYRRYPQSKRLCSVRCIPRAELASVL